MSHYSLGQPPPDLTAGFPDAAARIEANKERLAVRALEVALDRDPTIRERLGELTLRELLLDTQVFIERIARSVAANDPGFTREFADWVAPVYRRRRVPMDDLTTVAEGTRDALMAFLPTPEEPPANAAIDAAIEVFRWYRRIAGDARRRNRLVQFLYKGA